MSDLVILPGRALALLRMLENGRGGDEAITAAVELLRGVEPNDSNRVLLRKLYSAVIRTAPTGPRPIFLGDTETLSIKPPPIKIG